MAYPDVALEIGRIAEDFGAVLARVAPAEAVLEQGVPADQRTGAEGLAAQGAAVPRRAVVVRAHQMRVQPADKEPSRITTSRVTKAARRPTRATHESTSWKDLSQTSQRTGASRSSQSVSRAAEPPPSPPPLK